MRYFTCIGARDCPEDILKLVKKISAAFCSLEDFCMRSGGARGADSASYEGAIHVSGAMEIYIPWTLFNKDISDVFTIIPEPTEALIDLAAKFHPRWDSLDFKAKALIMRNGCQVLGEDLKTPSEFVVCWTKDGKASGGTGQAIRIAEHYKIPIFNLFNKGALGDLRKKYYDYTWENYNPAN